MGGELRVRKVQIVIGLAVIVGLTLGVVITILYCTLALVRTKAMKSSPLLGPFCGSEFWGFSLLKIYIGWVFLCFKLETIVSSALIHSTLLSS